jgi:molybdopterin converting factor small subunit
MTRGRRDFPAAGANIGEALRDLTAREPGLAVHFFDEAGALRRNIMLIHNEDYIRARDGLTRALTSGDTIAIMNRVSGG